MKRSRGQRCYERLLRLYPSEFRDEFGREMTRLYRDRQRAESFWQLWRALVIDLVTTAPVEHLNILHQDLRHAWRSLRHTPAIAATAVLTLALGIGASTAMFSVVHSILVRPLPYPESSRLVELFESNLTTGASQFRVSLLNYLSWRERARTLEAIGAFNSTAATLTGNGDPELLSGTLVTASLFRVLRVTPLLGRELRDDDEQRTSPPVVVISEALWRTRFGGDRHIIGRAIVLDGERHQIVAVMPRAFREVGRSQVGATAGAQLFLPLRFDRAQENRGNHTLRVVGRLRPGVRIEQARDDLRGVAAVMAQEFPAANGNWSARVDALSDTMLDPQVRRSLILMLGAVTMVFLIACANVANLLLVRATRQDAELAVRTALGAGRSRLVRQLLTESGALSLVSGAAGVLAAAVAHPLILALLPATLPRLDEMRVDVSFLAGGLFISMLSGVVFGLTPALGASRRDPTRALTSVGRASTDSPRARLRHVFIVGQVGLATTLLIAAALLLQGLVRLQRVPLGFDGSDVLTARLPLPRATYNGADAGQFYRRLLTTLGESGQVQAAAVATSAPFAPGVRVGFQLADVGLRVPDTDATDRGGVEHIVSDDYFEALRIPIAAGRSFTEQDQPGSPGVVVVSQRFARQVWPDSSPLGRALQRAGRGYEVVGVVGDVRGSDVQGLRGGGAEREPRAAVYFAASQLPQRTMTLLVRATGAPATVTGTVRESVRALDPTIAIQQLRPLTDWFADAVDPPRVTATLAGAFAVCALLLTAVGIYGVLASAVASRTKEIGIRIAIGASRARVVGLVVRDGMMWAGSGILIGVVAASAASHFMAALLFEVRAGDPMTFAIAAGAVALAALAACSIPASRAVRIDPVIAIRSEC